MRFASNRFARLLALLMALTLVAAACGDDDGDTDTATDTTETDSADDTETDTGTDTESGGAASGSISVNGSSTVEPVTNLVAEAFNAENPEVGISVAGDGTGDGFAQFCAGETDISDASRPIADDEVSTCEENGVEYVELQIAIDGIAVLTSSQGMEQGLPECLTFEDVYALVGPESEGFNSWSDANELATEVGGEGGFPDVPLTVTAPGEESGTYDTFVEFAIEDLAEERVGEDGAAARADYTSSPNDNVIIEGITGNPTSFGWVGYSFYENNQDGLAAFELDGGDGCVELSAETIADGSYPMSRPLFIYVNTEKAAENQALADFVDYYLSSEGIVAVEEAGYVALPDDVLEETVSTWEGR